MKPPASETVLLDTGAWLEGLMGNEPWASAMEDATTLIVPGLVLAEVDYHLRRSRSQMHRLVKDLSAGAYRYEPPTPEDLLRAGELDRKFKDIDLGLVDASIGALAERLGVFHILTIDSDFAAMRLGPKYSRAFQLVCSLP
jgi:predicted nucleic acid-binding protein